MKVQTKIKIYEIDDKETELFSDSHLTIHSHGWTNRVILEIEGKRYTVVSSDLRMAIQNGENHR